MLRFGWVILFVVGCGKQRQDAPTAQGSGQIATTPSGDAGKSGGYYDSPSDAVVAVVVDASVDARPAGPLPVDSDHLLDVEAIGPLKHNMKQAEVLKALGNPRDKTLPQEEAATGEFASTWTWPGVTVEIVSETRTGAGRIRLVTVKAKNDYVTARGIKVGSRLAEVAAAYPKSDEGSDDPTQFLVGSPYGGLLFVLQKDTVVEITMGAMAF